MSLYRSWGFSNVVFLFVFCCYFFIGFCFYLYFILREDIPVGFLSRVWGHFGCHFTLFYLILREKYITFYSRSILMTSRLIMAGIRSGGRFKVFKSLDISKPWGIHIHCMSVSKRVTIHMEIVKCRVVDFSRVWGIFGAFIRYLLDSPWRHTEWLIYHGGGGIFGAILCYLFTRILWLLKLDFSF